MVEKIFLPRGISSGIVMIGCLELFGDAERSFEDLFESFFQGEKGDPGLMGLPGLRGPPGLKASEQISTD